MTTEDRHGTVLLVMGTRPEAIKMLPVARAFNANPHIRPVIVSTGQHTELVRDVLALADLKPDVELDAAGPGSTLNTLFAHIVERFEQYVTSVYGEFGSPTGFGRGPAGYPVACFVHGDTTSAAAAALASFQLKIPVAHVEAGLRTSDTLSPFPEELNRQLISRIAAFHLAPTYRNEENLIRERVRHGRIFVTGNTAIDALLWASTLRAAYGAPELADLEDDEETRVVVVTAHRRESWGAGIERIARAIAQLATRYPDVRFVLPVHPNPAVADIFRRGLNDYGNVSLVKPMGYTSFARLLGRAHLAITDSGGIQEEAPALGTPVIVVRETTERQEGVDAGTLELVGTDTDAIIAATSRLLDSAREYARRCGKVNPYGDGRAADRIVAACEYIAFGSVQPAPYGSGFNRFDIMRAAGYADDPAEQEVTLLASEIVGDVSSG